MQVALSSGAYLRLQGNAQVQLDPATGYPLKSSADCTTVAASQFSSSGANLNLNGYTLLVPCN